MAQTLGALALLVLTGYAARRSGLVGAAGTPVLAAFVYVLALPALFFAKFADMAFAAGDRRILVFSVAAVALLLGLFACLYGLGWIERKRFLLASLSVVFGSNAFFGLAFFQGLYPPERMRNPVLAAFVLGVCGVLGSKLLLEAATGTGDRLGPFKRLLKSPIVIGIGLGALCRATDVRPALLVQTAGQLGACGPVVAMVVLGMFVHDRLSVDALRRALPYALLRAVTLPLAGAGVLLLMPPGTAGEMEFLFLQTGVPAAISLAVFAERYDVCVSELTGVVILTSAFSFPLLVLLRGLVEGVAGLVF